MTGLGPLRTRLQRSAGRGLTKFVGREREMEAMQARRRACDTQATDRSSRRWRRRAPASRGCSSSSRQTSIGLDGARDVLGLARQGVGLLSGARSAARLFRYRAGGRREDAARESQRTDRRRSIAALEDTRPYLFALLGIVEGDGSVSADGRRRSRNGARSKRSSASCCASRSTSR